MSDSVTSTARDPREGMWLEELDRLVERAKALGLPPDSPVRASVTISGKVKSLTVQGP